MFRTKYAVPYRISQEKKCSERVGYLEKEVDIACRTQPRSLGLPMVEAGHVPPKKWEVTNNSGREA